MKRNSGSFQLPARMLIWGIAALALRKALYAAAVDVKGLLLRNHPLSLALTVLTIGVLIRIVLAVRKTGGTDCYEDLYASDFPVAVGNAAAGAGILVTVLSATGMAGSYLEHLWRILGLAAPACLLLAAVAGVLGKKPFFLLHVVACLFFVLHIVTRYQLWSSNPQMQDYVFALLGAMALMFFGFYTAAMEAGCGSFRMRLGMGLAAIYLCLGELAHSSCPALYLGGLLWVLADLCSMRTIENE